MAIDPDYKLFCTITPNQHEKDEWSRLAQHAYAHNHNAVGHTYSTAASLPRDGQIRLAYFDKLQDGYREWLIRGTYADFTRTIENV